MEKNNVFFSSNIKWWRKEHKMSQTEFAKWLDKKTSVISAYENGKTLPRLGVLTHMSNILGITVDELMNTDLSKSLENYSSLNGNVLGSQNSIKTEKEQEKEINEEIDEVLSSIEFYLFRIEEVKDLIRVLVENYNFKSNENLIFGHYKRRYDWLEMKDLDKIYSNKKQIDIVFLNKYDANLNKLLFSIYEDLFGITHTYNVLMAK